MRVLIDTNVILDILQNRQPFFKDSYNALQLALNKCSVYISATTVTDVVYITRKAFNNSLDQKKALKVFFSQFRICAVKNKQLNQAFSSSISYFEDAVQAFCAKHYHVSYIITRNTKDYKLSPVKAIEPADFNILFRK